MDTGEILVGLFLVFGIAVHIVLIWMWNGLESQEAKLAAVLDRSFIPPSSYTSHW